MAEELEEEIKNRLNNFSDEMQRFGTTKGFKNFAMYSRGKEELVISVVNEPKDIDNKYTSPPISPVSLTSGSTSRRTSFSVNFSSSITSRNLPYDKRSLMLSAATQIKLGRRDEEVGLPPASPSDHDQTSMQENTTLFLLGAYVRYNNPYVWIRTNHERLISLSGFKQSDKDSPLKLKSTSNWFSKDFKPWHCVEEIVRLCTYPPPINPFEIDRGYFTELPLDKRIVAEGAMISILTDIVNTASDGKPYISKVINIPLLLIGFAILILASLIIGWKEYKFLIQASNEADSSESNSIKVIGVCVTIIGLILFMTGLFSVVGSVTVNLKVLLLSIITNTLFACSLIMIIATINISNLIHPLREPFSILVKNIYGKWRDEHGAKLWRDRIDYLQYSLKCCGFKSLIEEYGNSTVPDSCSKQYAYQTETSSIKKKAILDLIDNVIVANVATLNHYEENLIKAFATIESDEKLMLEWKQNVEMQKNYKVPNFPFQCSTQNMSGNPQNVHELKPGDINAIAAFGDSVTAGNGIHAQILPEVALQVRGVSWSIGGDKSLEEHVYTITNILKKYNPNIKGYSTGIGWDWEENSWLNVAVPGGKARDFPDQADELIQRFKRDSRIDYLNDWKLITLFVGGNDLCQYCFNNESSSPAKFVDDYRVALDKLHAEVPRALVQIVPMFDVSPIRHLSTGFICDIFHSVVCSCGINEETRPQLRPVQLAYAIGLRNLISSGRYDTRNDFTVVYQPYLRDLKPPRDPNTGEYDKSLFSPDCFHPNEKGHSYFAVGLWNQMLVKVGQKRPDVQIEEVTAINCPKQTDYLWTRLNSGNVHVPRR